MDIKILICVVIYNQTLYDCNSYKTLLKNYPHVIIIDNSTQINRNNQEIAKSLSWEYIHRPDNPGLGFAYNYAAACAKRLGYDWLFLSDQDTVFDKNIIEEYQSLSNHIKGINLFCPRIIVKGKGLLSPVKSNYYFPRISKTIIKGNTFINPSQYAIINSGMLINLDAYYKVGGYNENVFLDFSDFQFIEKFSQFYNKAYVTNSICYQEFSDDVQDSKSKLERFSLFCKSIKKYKCKNILRKLLLHIAVLKRTVALTLKFSDLQPFNIFIKDYLL